MVEENVCQEVRLENIHELRNYLIEQIKKKSTKRFKIILNTFLF